MRARRTLAFAVALGALAAACQKVPYTGRSQLNLVPDSVMNDLGKSSFQQVVQQEEVVRGTPSAQTLQKVGTRIAKVANQPDYDWTFALLDSEDVNAWALPGGYIGFYTGILPTLRNEAGMAFVMGHEVGHATAEHGSERLSQQLAIFGGLSGLQLLLAGQTGLSEQQRAAMLQAIGLGVEIGVVLPYSRTHEQEADIIGLMYMSRAGYPPRESIDVWDRMAEAGGARPPEFLSTHPAPETRQATLEEYMPQALKRYERNKRPGEDPLRTLWTRGGGGIADAVEEEGER